MAPAATSTAPCQITQVIDEKTSEMIRKVISARKAMRFRAVLNTASVALVSRSASRSCWLRPGRSSSRRHLSRHGADIGNSILAVLKWRARAGRGWSAEDDQRDADQHHRGELGCQDEQDHGAGDAHHQVAKRDRYGGADDLLDDGSVDRDPAGDLGGRFSSKIRGEAQQVAVHGRRMSATTRSPSQLTGQKRTAVASAIISTRNSRYWNQRAISPPPEDRGR